MKTILFTVARVVTSVLLLTVCAEAADYFVAPAVVDQPADGSMSRPFVDIDRALSLAEPGDRIVLRGGEYRLPQTLRFPRGGEHPDVRSR